MEEPADMAATNPYQVPEGGGSKAPADTPTSAVNAGPTASFKDGEDEDEDEDEWEYEYSNTETETYYLPIDLSIPQLAQRQRPVRASSRGGHQYRNWTGPTFQKRPEMKHHRLDPDEGEGDDEENDEEPLRESGEDEDEDDPRQNADSQAQADDGSKNVSGGAQDEGGNDELQVLGLHTERPLFLYRNRVFEGSWSRVIGTELLFTEQPPPDPSMPRDPRRLPSLRSLPGGVDLLSAGWPRIVTTEKKLRPKKKEGLDVDPLREIKEAHGLRIPIWSDKTGERRDQTRFLEDLMAIKLQKGEKDEVTIYATATEADKKVARLKRTRRGSGRAGHEVVEGEAADDDAAQRKRRRYSSDAEPLGTERPRARGTGLRALSSRGRGARRARPPGDVGLASSARANDLASERSLPSEDADDASSTISTPTPRKWADLEGVAEPEAESGDRVETFDEETSDDDGDDDKDDDDDGGGDTAMDDAA